MPKRSLNFIYINTNNNIYVYILIYIDINSETYSIDEAIEAIGFGKFQVKVAMYSGMAWVSCHLTVKIVAEYLFNHTKHTKLSFIYSEYNSKDLIS